MIPKSQSFILYGRKNLGLVVHSKKTRLKVGKTYVMNRKDLSY